MKSLIYRPRHLTVIALLLLGGGIIWFFGHADISSWRAQLWEWVLLVHGWLKDAPPLVYFTAAGLLPLFGVPMVSFYLLSASLYSPPIALLGTYYSLLVNLFASFVVGRVGHGVITRVIEKGGRTIPQIPPRHRVWMTAAVRVTPGAPLMLQNYLLVLAGVPLWVYVLVSFPLEILISSGYVLVGSSIFTGNWYLLPVALLLIALGFLLIRQVRRRSLKKSEALNLDLPDAPRATDVSCAADAPRAADAAAPQQPASGQPQKD